MDGESVTVESIAQAIRARYETTAVFEAEPAEPTHERRVEDQAFTQSLPRSASSPDVTHAGARPEALLRVLSVRR